jgi:hypothetical protein
VVHRSHPAAEGPDLEHGRLPDTLGDSIKSLMNRIDALEAKVNPSGIEKPHLHTPVEGIWRGEDFMI